MTLASLYETVVTVQVKFKSLGVEFELALKQLESCLGF